MARRVYTTGVAAPFVVAVDAAWEATHSAIAKMKMSATAADYAMQSPAAEAATGVANQDTAVFQGFYGPLAAQTIDGTVKGQFLARESAAATDARAQLIIRVIAPDGTVRGTCKAQDTGALSSEFNQSTLNTGIRNRKFPLAAVSPVTLSSVAAQAGDYLVIEIGYRNHGTNTGTVRIFDGEPSATTDLPEDETTAGDGNSGTTYRGWIEFSRNIGLLYTQSLTGAMTPAGGLVKKVKNAEAGAFTPAGALAKKVAKPMAGAMTPSGSLAANLKKFLSATGAMTPAGSLFKKIALHLAGANTPAGGLVKKVQKPLSGTEASSGTLSFRRPISIGGSITPTGLLVKKASIHLSGGITPTSTDVSESSYIILPAGALHIGKFLTQEPLYTIENEIIDHDSVDESRIRANIVSVDGQIDSWTEYSRDSLVTRDSGINAYLDLPELNSLGEVQQRAVEEIQASATGNSPGGTITGPRVLSTTRMDSLFWIDEHGNKYQTRIEGKHVEFNQSLTPFQHARIDTGVLIYCPPGDEDVVYVARDTFDREDLTSLGEAITGGTWTTYT